MIYERDPEKEMIKMTNYENPLIALRKAERIDVYNGRTVLLSIPVDGHDLNSESIPVMMNIEVFNRTFRAIEKLEEPTDAMRRYKEEREKYNIGGNGNLSS